MTVDRSCRACMVHFLCTTTSGRCSRRCTSGRCSRRWHKWFPVTWAKIRTAEIWL